MTNNKLTDGVGKKIVEALKMQTDVEVKPMTEEVNMDFVQPQGEQIVEEDNFVQVNEAPVEKFDYQPKLNEENVSFDEDDEIFSQPQTFAAAPAFKEEVKTVISDEFEVPSNVAVLKQLISKLPAGVTKQTGALIIKQTMEALGISMRSVLQEAQQMQEGLNNSSRECQASIMEYKKQIGILEKQAQKYQRQYAALNDIISLFVQTSI